MYFSKYQDYKKGYSIWNGGRINSNEPLPVDRMQTAISLINNLGIAVRYTFTNSLIKREHLLDEKAAKEALAVINGINVSVLPVKGSISSRFGVSSSIKPFSSK